MRWLVGRILLFLNAVTSPRGLRRSPEAQSSVDRATQYLSLYQFEACPFCIKVRRTIKRLSLNIELRDAKNNKQIEQELIAGGGKRMVPCLRIAEEGQPVRWMYESSDIVDYLNNRFAS